MAFFGLFGRRPKRRRVQTSAQRRYVPGARAKRYLERVAELEDVQRRRRRSVQTSAQRPRPRPPSPDYDDPTVAIDTRAVERELAKRRRDREQAEREQRRERERAERERIRERQREAKQVATVKRQRERAIEAYMSGGFSRAEAEEMLDREPDWATYDFNPRRRRNVRARSWPSRRTNPGLSSVVGELVKETVKGGLVAAAQEEAKEWRNRWHERRGRPTSRSVTVTVKPPRRANPARLEPNHPGAKLREMSERFHGRPDQILHLDADQRRPPPQHVVLIGQERATVYRVPRGSERAGADWEHEAGDRGMLRRSASGRRILVADEKGRVYLLRGSSSMRFDPDRGLVG